MHLFYGEKNVRPFGVKSSAFFYHNTLKHFYIRLLSGDAAFVVSIVDAYVCHFIVDVGKLGAVFVFD